MANPFRRSLDVNGTDFAILPLFLYKGRSTQTYWCWIFWCQDAATWWIIQTLVRNELFIAYFFVGIQSYILKNLLRVVIYTQPSMIPETWRKRNRPSSEPWCHVILYSSGLLGPGSGVKWIRYQSPSYPVFLNKISNFYFNSKTDSQVLPLGAVTYAAVSSLPVAQWVGSIPACYSQAIWSRGGGWAGHMNVIAR